MSKEIAKLELRFAVYKKASDNNPDIHYLKECITHTDGTKTPRVSTVINFERPIWITHPRYRNHKEKKEFEDLDKVVELKSSQSNLNVTIAKALEKISLASNVKSIKDEVFLYGYDITSTAYIKYKSLLKNNNIQSPYTVATFDIETNVITKEIILATIAMEGKAYTAILKSFVSKSTDVINRVHKGVELYLPKYKDLDYKVEIFNNEIQLLKAIFNVATDWAPDFLAIWNMDYDIPYILDRIKKYKVDAKDILCDRNLPKEYKHCYYKQGIKKKVTASGVIKPIHPALQWHTLELTAPFYVIDAMCVYKQIRIAKQDEPSYSLDSILKKELNTQKLKFTEADGLTGLKWHNFMREKYPIEYTVYNLYDCLSMLELDNKTKDLTNALPAFSDMTDFAKFSSNPTKIVNALFRFCLDKKRIIGTASRVSKIDEDEIMYDISDDDIYHENGDIDVSKYKVLDLKNWIITLPQHLLVHNGMKCIEENPNIVTNIHALVFDSDVSSSYPSCTLVANVSKETTENEIIEIQGLKEEIFREQNLGFILGDVSALEYCSIMLGLPTLEELDNI